VTLGRDPAHTEAIQSHTELLETVQTIRADIAVLEEQREATRKRLDRGDSFLTKFLSGGDPADLKASLNAPRATAQAPGMQVGGNGAADRWGPPETRFFVKDHAGRLGEYLNEPETRTSSSMPVPPARRKLRTVRACSRSSLTGSNNMKFSITFWPAMKSGPSLRITARPCTYSSSAGARFQRGDEASRAGHQAGSRKEIVSQGYRGALEKNTPLFPRGNAGHDTEVRQRLPAFAEGFA